MGDLVIKTNYVQQDIPMVSLCWLWLDIPIYLFHRRFLKSDTKSNKTHHHFNIRQWIFYLSYAENVLAFFVIEAVLYDTMS